MNFDRDREMLELWDIMVSLEICTDDEIGVACHFGGRTIETLESLLFYKTGCRNLEQLYDE